MVISMKTELIFSITYNYTTVTLNGSDSTSHRIRAVRDGVSAGLVWRGERGRLVDDHHGPLHLPGRGRRGGKKQGIRLALLTQAVVPQRSWWTEGLQSLWVLVLRVR